MSKTGRMSPDERRAEREWRDPAPDLCWGLVWDGAAWRDQVVMIQEAFDNMKPGMSGPFQGCIDISEVLDEMGWSNSDPNAWKTEQCGCGDDTALGCALKACERWSSR